MIPASFDYEVAETIEHALELLGSDADTKVLAGGHSLVPALKLRVARPSKLVDIGRVPDLAYVRELDDMIQIGALTRHRTVSEDPLLRRHCPIVAMAAGLIGDPQVRHRGTIGGSLAHGDPASDLPAVMLALGAEMAVRDAAGARVVPASEFFSGVFETAVTKPGTMLVAIRVPKLVDPGGWSYLTFRRRAQDWATVGVAVVAQRTNGSVERTAVALTNMAATPVRASVVESALEEGASLAEAGAHAADGLTPPADTAASVEFRSHLARVLTRRALEEAAAG